MFEGTEAAYGMEVMTAGLPSTVAVSGGDWGIRLPHPLLASDVMSPGHTCDIIWTSVSPTGQAGCSGVQLPKMHTPHRRWREDAQSPHRASLQRPPRGLCARLLEASNSDQTGMLQDGSQASQGSIDSACTTECWNGGPS